jgi:putative endonuclease
VPYVYVLRCCDGSLYTGWTTDVARRVAEHSAGMGARYTRSHLPVELAYSESCGTRSEAMRREAEIKNMTREEKLSLIGAHS